MTRDEAEALAAKREKHKPRSMVLKEWSAVHDSVKGWHVALTDSQMELHRKALARARHAYLRGDMQGLLDAASDSLLAQCRATIGNGEQRDG